MAINLLAPAVQGINGAVEIIESEFARVPLDQLLGIGAFSLDRVLEAEPDFLVSSHCSCGVLLMLDFVAYQDTWQPDLATGRTD